MVKIDIFKYFPNTSVTMTKKVIETSTAVALGVQLCKPSVIPMYPITPQLG
jgi:hypothetical protein